MKQDPRQPSNSSTDIAPAWLGGGSNMAEQIRTFDWSNTPLGPFEKWPQSLKTSVNLILNSQHPMWIGWGPEVTFLYNDAYIHVLGLVKHQWALGRPASEVWAEIWDICGPLVDKVFKKGEATFYDDVHFYMSRGDFLEETFYSFSYSPIRDESGQVGGLFCPSSDATAQNLSARRTKTLSELAAHALLEKSVVAACATSAAILGRNPDDLPFVLIYLSDSNQQAVLAEAVGVARGTGFSPLRVEFDGESPAEFSRTIAEAIRTRQPRPLNLGHSDGLPSGPAGRSVTEAVILPLSSRETGLGVLVAGVNPTRQMDAEYHTFFNLVANQVATAIANANAYEDDRRRAEELAALDHAKTVFFSNVSHEFRTPLTLMLGPMEELLSGRFAGLDPIVKSQLDIVNRNAGRLLRLVNTLLDFTRIEAGRAQASYEPTDLSALTAELASTFRSAIERVGLRFAVNCSPLPEPVFVDHDMWEKIVLNLVSNAFKFTFEGEIEVSLKLLGTQAELRVRDTGVGISAGEMPRVFERFHRVEKTRSRTHEGSGIGLSLVQELVKLHGGNVWAESIAGQGTTFIVSLPFGNAHLPVDRLAKRRHSSAPSNLSQMFVEEVERWLPETTEGADKSPPPTGKTLTASEPGSAIQTGQSEKSRPYVIIADDNSDMRQYLSRLLSEHYDVAAFEDGEAAVTAARKRRPNLILCDVMMPRLDGFGLVREIRSQETTHTVPIILLSARAGEESRLEGLDSGADDYLVKPFSSRELLARVESLLKLSSVRQEAEQRVTGILESITDGFQTVDSQWRLLFLNAVARQTLSAQGLDPNAGIGKNYWEIFPAMVGREVENVYRRAMDEKMPAAYENFYEPWQRWYDIRLFPVREGGLSIFFQDITERKLAEEAQRAARQAAEEANQAKDRFLAALSHELRTPLTPALALLSELCGSSSLPVEVAQELNVVKRNIELETRLIDDLLDLTRVTRGKLELFLSPVGLGQVIEDAIATCQPDLNNRRLTLVRDIADSQKTILVDGTRITQILWNLLKNAIKFTPEGGTITILTRIQTDGLEEQLAIEVQDTGRGIEPEDLQRIFKAFEQGDRQITRQFGGLGLGLAISKAIAESHNGTLTAVSEGMGHGSTFILTLPCPSIIGSASNLPTPSANGKHLKLAPTATNGRPPLRILLVEDHTDTANSLKTLLTRRGYEVSVANNVAGGLKLAETQPFDLVLSDLGLPDASGLDLMRKIREKYSIPGIALSGYGMEEDIRKCRQAGFHGHLVKPIKISQLEESIGQIFG
jgi:signal transduction histidine kinase/CheY-like chemotaxis protein